MPFLCEPVVETQFESLNDVHTWISNNENQVGRISIVDLLQNEGRFFDDEYFGDEDRFLRFNQNGMQALLQRLGLRFETLQLVERPGLISELLNDLIFQRDVIDRLKTYDFVVDERSRTVLGGVSNSYVFYSNKEFVKDIEDLLGENQTALFPSEIIGRFKYVNGFSVNTQMFLRFALRVEGGQVTGVGGEGEGEDISEVGIQFRNSMVGDAAVSIQYFVHRLLCANGLIVPAGASQSRIFHSGKRGNFMERLKKSFAEVERKIGAAGKAIKSLMEIDFHPKALAQAKMSESIFDVIPGSRSRIMEEHNIQKRHKKNMKGVEQAEYEAKIIEQIPTTFAGQYSSRVFNSRYRTNATMFDFINIFTEYAQSQPIHRRLEIEEKAGLLADQIVKNRRKFPASQSAVESKLA